MSDKRARNQRKRKGRTSRTSASRGALSRCDFCCAAAPTWDFPCADFTLALRVPERAATVVVPFEGEWSACDVCHDLILRRDWALLAEYSIVRALDQKVPFVDSSSRDEVVGRIRQVQSAFKQHRHGSPTSRRNPK